MADKPSVWLSFFASGNLVCFNNSIVIENMISTVIQDCDGIYKTKFVERLNSPK